MEMAFSRGLQTGWLRGIDNRNLVHAQYPKKRGVHVGDVVSVGPREVRLALREELKAGDGVVFDAGDPEAREEGGRVWEVVPEGGTTLVRFGEGNVDFRRLRVGQRV